MTIQTVHGIKKTLANTVIRNEDGLEGILVERSDSYNPSAPWVSWSGLVLWDGWMGTTWVKSYEMTIVADLVKAALAPAHKSAVDSLQSRMGTEGDHLGRYGEKYYERQVKAFDMALQMVSNA